MRTFLVQIAFFLVASSLIALPENGEVVSGEVTFQPAGKYSLDIVSSDKAIVNYQKFNIGEGEQVRFIQPSAKSTILNRVVGENPSKILGNLTANGRVFLVNPSGIYFGPQSVVNTGAFVASTLNILDEDFKAGKYRFFKESSSRGTIVNEGKILSSSEGFIAFFAPMIENRGSIIAQAGKVVLAAAERVTLDFTGDGLIQFSVEGKLKKALIENYGNIEAANGSVELSLQMACSAMKMVVNTDGIVPATGVEESNGVIRLVGGSALKGERVRVEGDRVDVQGKIDVSSREEKGGKVELLGDQVQLVGGKIDACGARGGGAVLVGGDYQGKGELRTAENVVMDRHSEIDASGTAQGDGGRVILWADEVALFNGKIYARGGANGGNGGFVETSGGGDLGSEVGYVDTFAPAGEFGNWLLDPRRIQIRNGGGASLAECTPPSCGTNGTKTIDPTTVGAATSNVHLCAQRNKNSSIQIVDAVTMINPGVSLTLTAGSTGTGAIQLQDDITTNGGAMNLVGRVILQRDVALDTTNGGGAPAGGDISFSNTIHGARELTLNGGTGGTVSFGGTIGKSGALKGLIVTSANLIEVGDDIKISQANPILFGAPVNLTGSFTITSTKGDVTFGSTLDGGETLTLAGNKGTLTLSGAVGGTTPLSSLVATTATIIQSSTVQTTGALSYTGSTNIDGNITTSGGLISITGPLAVTATSFDTTNGGGVGVGGNIIFSSTLNGAIPLNLNGGTGGTISFGGAIGGVTPLTSLTTSGLIINQNSSVETVGALSYTGTTAINIGGDITTSGGTINLAGPTSLSGSPTFDTTNGDITFSNTLNGATSLTLRAGAGGNVIFSGAVGEIAPLTNLTFTSANLIQIGNNIAVSGANPLTFPFPAQITGPSTITTNNGNLLFNSTVDDDAPLSHTLHLAAGSGSITLIGNVGGSVPLRALTISSANQVTANAITVGALSQSSGTGTSVFNGAIQTSNLLGVNLTGSSFNFNDTVTTTGGGVVTIANSGTLSIPSGSTFTVSGQFSQTGTGPVHFGDTVTSDEGILVTAPVSLINHASFTTDSQLITFKSTIDSVGATPFDISFDSGMSNTDLQGNTGSTRPLRDVLFSQADNITMGGVTANSITINGGAGLTTVNGALQIGAGGVNATGHSFFADADIFVTNGGAFTVNFSGVATRNPGHPMVVDGDYTVIGTGPAFAGSLLTVNGDFLITAPLTIAADAVVDTSGGGGNITFGSLVNGAKNFTLITGSGDLTFSGDVGSVVPLGNLQITSAHNVTAEGIRAASITQLAGTGTTTFNGPVTTSGAGGISINTSAIIRGAAISTTGGGGLTITNSGLFTSTAAGAIALSGPFNQNGAGAVSFGGNLTASSANLSFSSLVTLAGDTFLNTGVGAGSITLSQGAQGAFALTLNSGMGDMTVGGALTPLTSLTITKGKDISTQAITAGFITQAAGTGTTIFNGAVTTSGASGLSLTGTNFTFNDTFTTGGTGGLTVTHTGLLTLASGSVAGAVDQTGTGSTLLSGTITAGGSIQFAGPFAVSGTASLTTEAANQPITFFDTLDGPGNLTLSSGTGDIIVSGNGGASTPLGDLVISTTDDLTFLGSLAATSITQSAGTGTTLFTGDVSTSGAGGMALTGNAFTFLGNGTASGTGTITIANGGTLTTTAGKTVLGAGGFSQTGAGAVSLGSAISSTSGNTSFVSPITLTSNVTLNSGTGDITVDTVDGYHHFTLTAGQDIFAGVIGGVTRLGTLTITTVRDVQIASTVVGAMVQLAGSGTTTFTGDVNTDGPAGINLTGTHFTRSGEIITTNGGNVSVTHTGLITGTAISTTAIDGSYIQVGVGPSASFDFAGTISARTGIAITGPVNLRSDPANTIPAILDSSSGNGNISITGAIDNDGGAPHTLILRSGGGNITLTGGIGGTTPIGPLLLGDVNDFTGDAIACASIAQEALALLTGQTTFNNTLTTSGAAGIVLDGNAFTFNDTVTTTGSGPVTLTNSGLLSIPSGTAFTLDGPFTQSGTGTASLGGSITTPDVGITFAAPITLTGAASLDSGGGAGNITLNGAIDGANSLTLAAGTGDVTLQSDIGQTTPLTGLTIQNGATILVNTDATVAGPFTITAATGTTTINDLLEATTVSITGAAVNFNQAVSSTAGAITVNNSGTFTTSSIAPIAAATSFTQTGAGTVSLGSNVIAAGTLSIASPITLTQNVALNSGGGDLTLSDAVSGVFDLTLTAGAGDMTLSGNVGSPRIGNFTIASGNDINVQAITAASISLLSSTGTATLNGALDADTLAGITLVGNNFITSGAVTTTNGGPLVITNSGFLTATGASVITLNGGGSFTQNGAGLVNVGGTLTTQGGNISHTSPINVPVTTTFTSNGGDITFQDTIDGIACLTLDAGTGDVVLNGAVGATTPLGCLDASGAEVIPNGAIETVGTVQLTGEVILDGAITTAGSGITLTGDVTIENSLTLTTGVGGGDITITGTVNGDGAGKNFTLTAGAGDITLGGTVGAATPFNDLIFTGNNISWEGIGGGGVGASGTTTLNATTDITFSGTTYHGGTQSYTAGGDFHFTAGALTTLTSNNKPITFSIGTIELGTTDLTVVSHGGAITIATLEGGGRILDINADTGAMNFVQIGSSGNNLSDVTLTSDAIIPTPILDTNVFADNLTIATSSAMTILSLPQLIGNLIYNGPVTVQGNIVYSCGSAGTITFNDTVDADTAGVDTLAINFSPCTGSVIFNAPVGSNAPLASISIDGATDVTTQSTVDVGTLSVTNGTGTVAINAGLDTTAAGGISLTTPIINLLGAITTGVGGDLTLNNSGALTVTPGTGFTMGGAFLQTGAGAVSIGGNISTSDATIQFTGPVTLGGMTTFNSTGGDISFGSTVEGAKHLTLQAGTGAITLTGAVGTAGTPLTSLTISSAGDVTASSPIFATTFKQLGGTGLSIFDAITTTALNGIQLTGKDFTFSGDITTNNSGSFLLNHSGTASFAVGGIHVIPGAVTQSGAGSVNLAGTFTVGGNVSFAQGVTLTGATTIDTSANGTPIAFSSPITGSGDLTLSLGTGTLTSLGTIGSGVFTISSVGNASLGTITATSITQTAGSGTTTIIGDLTTSGAIDLTGTNLTLNGTLTGGSLALTNSGPLSLTLGGSTLIDGPFTQSGGGAVSLSGTLSTNSQNLTFTNPITLTGGATLATGGGTLTLSSTVNGNHPLTLTAGTGNVVFGANLGTVNPIGPLTITTVQNITYPEVHATSIVQSGSSGTTTITGPLNTTGALGVAMTGGAINQNGAIVTIGTGGVTFTHTGALTIASTTVAAGGYTQNGGGTVSLGGNITTTNSLISFADPVALTTGVTLTAGPLITFNSPITGAQTLSLTATGGTITLGGDVGTVGTPLTSLTLAQADNTSTQGIFADTITQSTGTGTTTFNGGINASGLSGISLTGEAFTFNDTITSSGSLTIANTGLATFNSGATGSITGAFTQNGAGGVQLSSVLTAGGAISLQGIVTASGTGNLTATNQPITFLSAIEGPGNLTLSSGTGDITMHADVGGGTRLGTLTLTTVKDFSAENITATSFAQSAGSGTTLLDGDLNTNGGGGISITGTTLTFAGDVTATGGGPITLTNSGTLTMTIDKTVTAGGTFTQNGSGSVLLGSGIVTTSGDAGFTGTSPITLTAPVSINTSGGGGTINFSAASTIDGAQPLTLNAGAGDINILGALGGGIRLGALTISGHDIQLQALTVQSLSQLAGTGTSSFLEPIDTNAPAGINLVGNNFTLGPLVSTVTTTNGGPFTITNQGLVSDSGAATITIDGSFIQNGPGPIIVGPLSARQGMSFTGPVIVGTSGTLDSSSGNGDITFNNLVSALAGTEDLTLDAGTGDITFTQPIGLITTIGGTSVTALGSLTLNGDAVGLEDIGTNLAAGVTGTVTVNALSEIFFAGTTYHGNTQDYNATQQFHIDGGALTTFLSGGSPITFQGAETLLGTGTDLTINTAGGALTLEDIHAQVGSFRTLNLDAGGGSIQIGNIGAIATGEFVSATFVSNDLTLGNAVSNAFSFAYTGTINILGNLISVDTPLTFPNPVVLQSAATFSTLVVTGAPITFSSTVNGIVHDAFALTLSSGGGDIIFSSTVGLTGRLRSLIIGSANNVTLGTGVIDGLIQANGFGTTTLNGSLTIPGVFGASLTGNNFAFNGSIQTLNNAPITVANSGLLTVAGSANVSGGFTQSTPTGNVTLSGTITAGQPITFAGPITLAGTPSLDTSAANQTITLSNTIGGSGDLTLAAGSGDIFLLADMGTSLAPVGTVTIASCHDITTEALFAQSVQVASSTGQTRTNGELNTSGAGGISLTGNNFLINAALTTSGGGALVVTNSGLLGGLLPSVYNVDGGCTQNGTGPVNFGGTLTTTTGPISFASPVTLLGPATFNSSVSNQDITFLNTINGPAPLSIVAGEGTVTFTQTIGENVPLAAFTVNSSNTIHLAQVGTTASGVEGALQLQASDKIDFSGDTYNANTQTYVAGNSYDFSGGAPIQILSPGGEVSFTGGIINLTSDLQIVTVGGNVILPDLQGVSSENIVINSGDGATTLRAVSGMVNDVIVEAGKITFAGPISAQHIRNVSQTTIENATSPVLIESPNVIVFDALRGNVGSLANPIYVPGGSNILVGGSENLRTQANFSSIAPKAKIVAGSPNVTSIVTNPPCIIIVNGTVIKDCTCSPSLCAPGVKIISVSELPFAVPGFDSSQFNLASDFFFFPYFFNEDYLRQETVMDWRM